jgi:hypothetical protein
MSPQFDSVAGCVTHGPTSVPFQVTFRRAKCDRPLHSFPPRQNRYEPPPEFPLASPYSGIVHHLSGPNKHALTQIFQRYPDRSMVQGPSQAPSHQRSLSLRIRVCHPNTRILARLLGPCFRRLLREGTGGNNAAPVQSRTLSSPGTHGPSSQGPIFQRGTDYTLSKRALLRDIVKNTHTEGQLTHRHLVSELHPYLPGKVRTWLRIAHAQGHGRAGRGPYYTNRFYLTRGHYPGHTVSTACCLFSFEPYLVGWSLGVSRNLTVSPNAAAHATSDGVSTRSFVS